MALIRRMAVVRTSSAVPVAARYDPESQFVEVLEDGVWVPSWRSTAVPQSKKSDLETGEDQKGE
jgi:hypothetical protein